MVYLEIGGACEAQATDVSVVELQYINILHIVLVAVTDYQSSGLEALL